MKEGNLVLKGNIIYTPQKENLCKEEHSFLVCENGKVVGIFRELPEKYSAFPLHDYGDCVIIPGLIDLHVHAPQYPFRGIGMDMELLDWLNTYAFEEEKKYGDLSYAEKAYSKFVEDLKNSATTRAVIFATIHLEATILLMELLEKSGVYAMVGKVNMDRNSPPELIETTQQSKQKTEQWISFCKKRYCHVKPVITPRFIPSCTDELLSWLGDFSKLNKLPVQSHLSENRSEVAWVKQLCPNSNCYGDAYARFGLFGGDIPTVMAHGVYGTQQEWELMKKNNVYLAHCPESNINLSSGIAPVKKLLNLGVPIGLGSDVAGGSRLSIFHAATYAIQASKLRNILIDSSESALTVRESFYLATKGGGSFFGKTGSFETGYDFDAVVIDDRNFGERFCLDLEQRLQQILYLSQEKNLVAKYVCGKQIFERGTWNGYREKH